jgi:cell division transport system permease protein
MTFAMLIVAAAGLAMSNAAGVVAQGVNGRYVIQIPAGSGAVPQVVQLLGSTPGVQAVEAVPEAEMRRTLERWLGPAGGAQDLPVPAIVNFNLAADSDTSPLERAINRIAPGARISAHQDSVAPLLRSMRALQWLTLALVVLMGIATSATVVLAARGALDTNRPTIDVMHGIGATDLQVTHLFQRKIALDAATGAIAGGAAAGAVLLGLLAGGTLLSAEMTGAPILGTRDVIALILLPLMIVVLATWVARSAVLGTLRRSI